MAWAIWIFGSAFWSIFALAEAVRYFHSFTNGLGIVPPVRRGVRPDRSSSSSLSSSQVIRYRGQLLGSRRGSRRSAGAPRPRWPGPAGRGTDHIVPQGQEAEG